MSTFVYDGSYDGYLCVLARAVGGGEEATAITVEAETQQGGLFGETVEVATSAALAARTRAALVNRAGTSGAGKIYRAFLSEQPEVEVVLLRLVRALVEKGRGVLDDLTFEPAFRVMRWAQQVGREVHRMHAFVRFEERADGRWVATVEPDFNVLPLLAEHFEARYPAMDWAIADGRRRYALVHTWDGEVGETRFAAVGDLAPHAEREEAFQRMWQTYFHAVNIPERANPRLHLQHVPRRYWPYLTEKQGQAG